MRYPDVMTEGDTILAALTGASLARFGDGELAIAKGGKAISQDADPALRMELIHILAGHVREVLPCIPHTTGPRAHYWEKYTAPPFAGLMRAPRYGSAFVSRPDNAPWIDKPEYWQMVRALWRGRDVVYVSGSAMLGNVIAKEAASLQIIHAPLRNAYAVIDRLETECFTRNKGRPVFISLGAAGTALAARLAKRGIHALDLGHIGQFMTPEHEGAFAFSEDDLTSPTYRELIRKAHRETNWGRGGASWAAEIAKYADEIGTKDVLDYGAGGRTLAPALATLGIKAKEYDPGVPEISTPPKIADLVASTDVFEHIEPELIPNVMKHVYLLARKAGYFVIALQPAKKVLSDGRNAHVSLFTTAQWVQFLRDAGWSQVRVTRDEWKKCVIRCVK